jgi:CubicO group peptidase (beta-lactamase class C family)
MHERVLGPLGLDKTAVTRYPAFPGGALHAYTGERGLYEDCTFWSPSWSIGAGTVLTSTMADTVRGFREMSRGELISKQANRERVSPRNTAGLGIFNSNSYYGLGLLVNNGWQLQNPFIDGYTGLAAYLPAQDLSVGIVTTQLPQSSNNGVGYASELFAKLAQYHTPHHHIKFLEPTSEPIGTLVARVLTQPALLTQSEPARTGLRPRRRRRRSPSFAEWCS